MKLVVSERESEALIAALTQWRQRVSSALLATESVRAALRVSKSDATEAERLLEDVSLIPVTRDLLKKAGRLEPPSLRALDAIHLATAKSLGDELGVLFSYDERLLEAAVDAGIATESPSEPPEVSGADTEEQPGTS